MQMQAIPSSRRNSEPDSIATPHGAAVQAGTVMQPASAQPGQSVLLFPQHARAIGTPCEVARQLRARTEVLANLQEANQRVDEFNALIMRINDVRDEEKGAVMHLLLSKIPLLPLASRTAMLRDVAILAGGAAASELPGLYAQIARTAAALPPEDRPAALRSALLATGTLAQDSRGLPLPALAAALSSLHDAGAQQALAEQVCSLVDKSPTGQRTAALDQLAAVSWLSDTVRLAAHDATLQRLQVGDDARCATTLGRLATDLPKLPLAARPDAFHALLKVCATVPDGEKAALLTLLNDVIESLPDSLQVAARNAVIDAGGARAIASSTANTPDASTPASSAMTYAGYTAALAAGSKRSPANRKAALEALSVQLASLPVHQRAPAMYAWLNAISPLSATVRAGLIARLAREIRVLPDHLRLSALNKLRDVAEALPASCRDLLLATLLSFIGDLPETDRQHALWPFLTAAADLSSLGDALTQALAGAVARLPEPLRVLLFDRLFAMIQREPGMAPALADALPHLPMAHRHEAFHRLETNRFGSKSALFPALARALSALAEPDLVLAAVRLLRHPSSPQMLEAIVHGLNQSTANIPAYLLYSLVLKTTNKPDHLTFTGRPALSDAWKALMLRQPDAHWTLLTNPEWLVTRNTNGLIRYFAGLWQIVSSQQSPEAKAAKIQALLQNVSNYSENLKQLLVLPDDLSQLVDQTNPGNPLHPHRRTPSVRP